MRIPMDDGVALAVEVAGTGPTLVLVHGFGGAKEDFADHVPALSERFRVVVFDHRGHGEGDHPDGEAAYSLDRLAADTVAVADALAADRFVLLGHSMGGMVARRLVLAHPDRVDALVLMDTGPGPPPLDPTLAALGIELVRADGMDALRAAWDEREPMETPAGARLLAERPGYAEFCRRKWEAQAPAMWVALADELVHQPVQLAELASVTCPVLIVVGEQDATFLAASRAMADVVPGATLRVVEGGGHSPQFESPEVWFRALDAFLTSTVAEPA